MMAPAAILRRVCWVDLDKLPASFCRFARQLREKGRPRRIMNALSKTMVMRHAVDVQVFNRYHAELIDDSTALLMGEVVTPETSPFMHTGDRFAVLTSLGGTLRQFAQLALDFGKSFFFLAEKARVGNLFTRREGRERLESHINAHLGLNGVKSLRFALDREGHVPLASRGAMHGTRLDPALHRSMIHHLH